MAAVVCVWFVPSKTYVKFNLYCEILRRSSFKKWWGLCLYESVDLFTKLMGHLEIWPAIQANMARSLALPVSHQAMTWATLGFCHKTAITKCSPSTLNKPAPKYSPSLYNFPSLLSCVISNGKQTKILASKQKPVVSSDVRPGQQWCLLSSKDNKLRWASWGTIHQSAMWHNPEGSQGSNVHLTNWFLSYTLAPQSIYNIMLLLHTVFKFYGNLGSTWPSRFHVNKK